MNCSWPTSNLLLLRLFAICGLFFSVPAVARPPQGHTPVVLISIDGLKPEYVLNADAQGLKIPNLRRFLKEGTSTGVHGVVPTVTYPSHTTIITGVSPAKHGIYANTTFDPLRKNNGGWYWYSEDIKVPTIWDAAAAAGLTTANVHWPVSVAEPHITWNLPQYWRAGTPDDTKLMRVLATPGLLDNLGKYLGPYADGIDESIEGDENRAKFAERLIETKRPDFITIYLTALDTEEHASGPFSPQSNATLERIDSALGGILFSVAHTYRGSAVVCVVSDHGFVAADKAFHLGVAFRKAGLIEFDNKDKIKSWKAAIWSAGGSEAIVLRDKNDAATKAQVAELLTKLAADPANGIERIVSEEELHARGGFPDATFLVALRPGFITGESLSGELVTPTPTKGMHGYWPDHPEMNSSFFILGPGWSPRSLGEIDMRQLAPTLALILGVQLPQAEATAINRQ